MKLIPNALLGRVALYLLLATFVGQVLWFATAGYFLLRPLRETYVQQVVASITIVQAVLNSAPLASDQSSSSALISQPFGSIRIVPDSEKRPAFEINDDNLITDLNEELRARISADVLVKSQQDAPFLWYRFPARSGPYWLVMPSVRPVVSYSLIGWVGVVLALSVGGAYLIISRVTRQLRNVTGAVRAVGRGESPAPLAETGPQEIRDLGQGFNQMAADLKKIEKERRIMLAGISHDLRTPLTHLRIAVELAGTNAEPAIAEGMAGDIEEMDSILKQFLDYARDGSEEQPTVCDFNQLVHEVSQRYQLRGNSIDVSLGEIPPFRFKKLAMRRVFTNLIDNAVRYGQKGISIETWTTGVAVSFLITDTGPGIQGSPCDMIKPFAREDTARSKPGAGLGLAIVERIVQNHGGTLVLKNGDGGGFEATVEVPVHFFSSTRARSASPDVGN